MQTEHYCWIPWVYNCAWFLQGKNSVKYSAKNKPDSQKGTKRHKKEMKKAKSRKKRYETKRVMDLIEQLGQENIESNLPSADS